MDPILAVNAIIEAGLRKGLTLTHLQLQKILYFAHAMCLVELRRPLIDAEFEAWRYGPVCREVYSELRCFESRPIEEPVAVLDPVTGVRLSCGSELDDALVSKIEKCVDFFGRYSAGKLVELSHARDGPWDTVVKAAECDVNIGMRIDNETIVQRYRYHWLRANAGDEKEIRDEDTPFAANGLR
ncbi:Panacea domain-containing protein [Maricaulis sp.]|uniref:Panacea domain-containing protein n=1 Tax=Maricaulis sp. TaxID=1486257 RepID=UPI003A9592F0